MWKTIAEKYKHERDIKSNAYLILDDLIIDFYKNVFKANTVLDFGAGNGKHSFLIKEFVSNIYLYEPIIEMNALLLENIEKQEPSNFTVISNNSDFKNYTNFFSSINCSKVLDHIDNYEETLKLFHDMLKPKGILLLTIPHPIKYSGKWVKEGVDNYLYYKFDNYFDESKKTRSRENADGNEFISDVTYNHRIISTYFNSLVSIGFSIKKMLEPKPNKSKKEQLPLLYDQSIRVPNCIVFVCEK